MNRKGQNLLFAIMIAIVIFAVGMLFVGGIMSDVSYTRTLGLDCTNSSISDGAKVTCVGVDFVIPIFIIAIVSMAGGVLLARFLL